MTCEKYEIEINNLKKFYELYCKDKHENQVNKTLNLTYKEKSFSLELYLCEECQTAVNYSLKKLDSCPHDIKPSCRKCPHPCYEKPEWKNIAKVMKYSAIKLSLGKVKSRILKVFN